MDRDVLRRMDLNYWEMFREGARYGRSSEVIDRESVTYLVAPLGYAFNNSAMVRGPIDADALFAGCREVFAIRDLAFVIGTRAHADAELEAQLEARGWRALLEAPGMALLEDPGTRCEPVGLEIRPTVDEAGRRAYVDVSLAAWSTYGTPAAYLEDIFRELESLCSPSIQGFVGWLGDTPVAAAATYLTHGVAGIGWVGCVPEQRGKQYAEAVTWAATRAGLRRGGDFASLQASPMGAPVYRRMGYETLTTYRTWVGEL